MNTCEFPTFDHTSTDSSSIDSADDSSTPSDTDSSTFSSKSAFDESNHDLDPPYSPITSGSESQDIESDNSLNENIAESIMDTSSEFTNHITDKGNNQSTSSHPLFYKLVGDNIDGNIRPRYMRLDRKVKSIHYYHFYAVQDRINLEGIPKINPPSYLPSPDAIAKSLLPTTADDAILKNNFKILFTRILLETLPFFQTAFSGLEAQHIQHRRSSEMAKPSISA